CVPAINVEELGENITSLVFGGRSVMTHGIGALTNTSHVKGLTIVCPPWVPPFPNSRFCAATFPPRPFLAGTTLGNVCAGHRVRTVGMGDSISFGFTDEDSPVVTTGRQCLFGPFRDAAVVGRGSPLYVGECCGSSIQELATHVYWWEADKRVGP